MEILQQTYSAINPSPSGSKASAPFSEAKIDQLFDTMMLKKLQEQKENITVATVSEMRFEYKIRLWDNRSDPQVPDP